MSHKVVICHFYNEEYLLPWWLKHHKAIFDHGIMIDYASTDRSVEIIQELCPTWEIVPSRNVTFDADACDKEVQDYEGTVKEWRIALNVTEFLYGNYDHLNDSNEDQQYFISNYVFADMEDPAKGPATLDHTIPLYKQRYWGYSEDKHYGRVRPGGTCRRMNRSIHNYPVDYSQHSGRHFPGTQTSFDDLVIFYYQYASVEEPMIDRKLQIKDKMSEFDRNRNSGGHVVTRDAFINRIRVDHQSRSIDLRTELDNILKHNLRITGQEF
jgi:Glycosyl transferase family 2